MKSFNIFGFTEKLGRGRGGFQKTNLEGGLSKNGGGGLVRFADLRGGVLDKKEEGGAFGGEGVKLQCTLCNV